MTTTFTVRDAMATLLKTELIIPPAPTSPLKVFVSPEDDKEAATGIEITTFPTIIVQKGVYSQTDTWRKNSQSEAAFTWWLEMIVYLAQEKYPDGDVQELIEDWQTAVSAVILRNPTISDTIENIQTSDSGEFMFSRDGYYDWYTQDGRTKTSYWGLSFRMRVVSTYQFAEIVGVAP